MNEAPVRQIGEVATMLGLSLRTIRYYEEEGLVKPSRTEGGFRLYGSEEVARLQIIKQMKPLGFTLAEMGELLAARDVLRGQVAGDPGRAEAHATLSRFSVAAREKWDELRRTVETAERFARDLERELEITAD